MGVGTEIWDATKSAVGASLGEVASKILSVDPTKATGEPSETAVRNDLDFSDLLISFPTSNPSQAFGFIPMAQLRLPAYLTDFRDSYSPTWKEEQVFGRSDPIATYANTKRTMDLGFLIPCYDENDANENIKKVNKIIKNLYPAYQTLKTGDSILDAPPLARIKFANLITNHASPSKGLLGFITSFSTEFGIKERGVYVQGGLGVAGSILPRAIGFRFSFTVLHESIIGHNTQTNSFFGSEDYPYRTRFSFGDATNFIGNKIGLSAAVVQKEITGFGG